MTGWTVWVGGGEITDYPVSLELAESIADLWQESGYEDVELEEVEL